MNIIVDDIIDKERRKYMDPVINLGFISIHIYSICLFIAILLGSNLVIREAKRHGISENFIINLLFFE